MVGTEYESLSFLQEVINILSIDMLLWAFFINSE